MAFNADLIGFKGDLLGFNRDLTVFKGELMGCNGDLMIFNCYLLDLILISLNTMIISWNLENDDLLGWNLVVIYWEFIVI